MKGTATGDAPAADSQREARMSTHCPQSRVLVIIPALDEERALACVLRELPRDLSTAGARLARVIVVDNGSTDGTAAVAAACGAEVVHEPRRGYGSACLAGLAAARGTGVSPVTAAEAAARASRSVEDRAQGLPRAHHRSPPLCKRGSGADDIVVFLDADYSDHPEELPRLLTPIVAGEADFVLGSRLLGVRQRGAMPPQSTWGNRLACFLMRVLFGARYTDLGPFRAIRLAALERLGMRDRTFGWTVEMQIQAARLGLRTLEVPVAYRRRIGKSKISGTVRGSVRAGARILYLIARYGFG